MAIGTSLLIEILVGLGKGELKSNEMKEHARNE